MANCFYYGVLFFFFVINYGFLCLVIAPPNDQLGHIAEFFISHSYLYDLWQKRELGPG